MSALALNIDWLEVYCREDPNLGHRGASFFVEQGHLVSVRDYGTPVYNEMFTVLDVNGNPFVEVRRAPKRQVDGRRHAVLPEGSCHLRLVNSYCYVANAVELMAEFIERYGFQFVSISRIDYCLDFRVFPSGDKPEVFIRRYLKRVYAKVNQSELTTHGKDNWDGYVANSLKWGSPKSPVSTKLYDKTLELMGHQEKTRVPYKPYILQSWIQAGIISADELSTYFSSAKTDRSLHVWRLEFSLSSKVKKWLTVKNAHREESPHKFLSYENTLQTHADPGFRLKLYATLIHHYFCFKYYEESKSKYKCKDKPLFKFDESDLMKMEAVATVSKSSEWLYRFHWQLCKAEQLTDEKEMRRMINGLDGMVLKAIELANAGQGCVLLDELKMQLMVAYGLMTDKQVVKVEENRDFLEKHGKELAGILDLFSDESSAEQ